MKSLLGNKILVTIVGVALVAGGIYGIARFFGGGSSETAGQAKQLWTCSMHPQIIRNQPGNCPICNMALTPMAVESHDHGEAGGPNAQNGGKTEGGVDLSGADERLLVRVSPSVIQKTGIETTLVVKKKISREIRAAAHIDFNEESQAIINSRVNGWVEKLYVRFTGQTVQRGQALAAVYSPELVATQEEYLQLYKRLREQSPSGLRIQTLPRDPVKSDASASYDSNPQPEMVVRGGSSAVTADLKALLESARKRLRRWNISDAQIKNIETSGQVQRLLTLHSPYAGVVVEKKVVEGARITEGTDLFKIVDMSTVWVYVHIPEKDIPFVNVGMPAYMVVPQIPGSKFQGRVSFMFPYMEAKTRDLKIRLSFTNHRFQLRPGMYATLIMNRELSGEHIVIPSSAVIRTGEREIVFVYRGEGVFETREVETGVSADGGGTQILRGLKTGEAVVVSGQFLLDSESRIQETVRKMGAAASGEGGHSH